MFVYMWQGYVAKNPGCSPIRELSTPASTLHAFTQLTQPHTKPHILVRYHVVLLFYLSTFSHTLQGATEHFKFFSLIAPRAYFNFIHV